MRLARTVTSSPPNLNRSKRHDGGLRKELKLKVKAKDEGEVLRGLSPGVSVPRRFQAENQALSRDESTVDFEESQRLIRLKSTLSFGRVNAWF